MHDFVDIEMSLFKNSTVKEEMLMIDIRVTYETCLHQLTDQVVFLFFL